MGTIEESWTKVLCLRVSIVMKKHCDQNNSYEGKHLVEVMAYNFRDLTHYHHNGEYDSVQAYIVLI